MSQLIGGACIIPSSKMPRDIGPLRPWQNCEENSFYSATRTRTNVRFVAKSFIQFNWIDSSNENVWMMFHFTVRSCPSLVRLYISMTGKKAAVDCISLNSPAMKLTFLWKVFLCQKYFRYLHQSNTSVFSIISTIKWDKFHLTVVIITKVSLSGYVIYFSAGAHFQQYVSVEK